MNEDVKFLSDLDRLFIDHLTARDKGKAARVLVQKFEFLRDQDWTEAYATAKKVVELFGSSGDQNVMEAVEQAYHFLFSELPVDHADFVDICRNYGHFLHRRGDAHNAANMISEIEDALNGVDNSVAVSILENFLRARALQLPSDDEALLRARLASNYLYMDRFEDTIKTCTWLILHEEDEKCWDYIFWCGQAYMGLGRNKLAAMHFREVQRGLINNSVLALRAKEYLDIVE